MAYRLSQLTILWTLALLLLGSIVHATESSLACPDWPTCFGTMMPEMTGGVFWEHLHRLWAGALVLLFIGVVISLGRSPYRNRWQFKAGIAGVLLLLFQSVLGGLTVIYRLPDAISTSHLAAAFIFLGLAVALAITLSPAWNDRPALDPVVKQAGIAVAVLVFVQSLLGALVRHTDSGVACPDVPLCLGRIIPPLDHTMVQIHFAHRAVGIAVFVAVMVLTVRVLRRESTAKIRWLAMGMIVTVIAQVLLGFVSVATQLGVAPVSAHTLLAAMILGMGVSMAAYGWVGDSPAGEHAGAATAP